MSYLEILIQDHYGLVEFFLDLSTIVYDRMTRIVTYNVGNYAREKEALLMLVRALLLEINERAKVLYDTTVDYAPCSDICKLLCCCCVSESLMVRSRKCRTEYLKKRRHTRNAACRSQHRHRM